MGILTNLKSSAVTTLACVETAIAPRRNDITFYGSLALLGWGIFKLCKASSKLPGHADKLQAKINDITDQADPEKAAQENRAPISPEQAAVMTKSAKVETAWNISKDYALAGVLTVAGLVGTVKSRQDLKGDYIKTCGALIGIQELFGQYRDRVRTEEGQAADTHYMYGTQRTYIPQEAVDADGAPIIVKTPIDNVVGNIPRDVSIIEIYPDSTMYKQFYKDPGTALTFINRRIEEAKSNLGMKGTVMRNDIAEMIGGERNDTQEGLTSGYVWDKQWINAHGGDLPIKHHVHFVTKEEEYTKYIPNNNHFRNVILVELENLQDISKVSPLVNRFRR